MAELVTAPPTMRLFGPPPASRRCKTCAKCDPFWHDEEQPGLLSASGIAHIGRDGGRTACGRDATSDRWWWRA